jgi:hypothetical protein
MPTLLYVRQQFKRGRSGREVEAPFSGFYVASSANFAAAWEPLDVHGQSYPAEFRFQDVARVGSLYRARTFHIVSTWRRNAFQHHSISTERSPSQPPPFWIRDDFSEYKSQIITAARQSKGCHCIPNTPVPPNLNLSFCLPLFLQVVPVDPCGCVTNGRTTNSS